MNPYSDPGSPIGVAQHFAALTGELGELVRQLNEADAVATHAKVDFIEQYAMAWQRLAGTGEAKKQAANRATIEYRRAAEDASCEVRRLSREIDLMETRIGVGRSYGAAVRAEAAALGPWTEG